MKKNYLSARLLAFAIICFLSLNCSREESFEISKSGDITISMKSSAFTPETGRIVQGNTVTWVNDDNMVHRIVADNMGFHSNDMEPGEKFTVRFDEAGSYSYRCLHHPGMAAVLVLER